MDWFFKAVLTTGAVLLVMTVARRCGPRLAGAMAALPTVTAPALGWLGHDRGVEMAIAASIASVSVCAMLAAFAFGYVVAARRAGPIVALACGLAAAASLALPAMAVGGDLGRALLLAFVCCAAVCAALSAGPAAGCDASAAPMPCSSRDTTFVAATTGVLAALVATFGPAFGGFATGLLASLPLISGGIAVTAHVAGGRRAATDFLRGYVWGLFGKMVFGTVFALLARPLGIAPALLLACGGAALVATPWRPSASWSTWTGSRAVVDVAPR